MFGHWNELLREVGKVIIPGSVSGKTGCGTDCHGLGDNVVLGHSLDSMPSKVVSTLGDSVMIVTLQGPGEARGHCDTAGPCGTMQSIVTEPGPRVMMGPLWHCRTHGPKGPVPLPRDSWKEGNMFDTVEPLGTKSPL